MRALARKGAEEEWAGATIRWQRLSNSGQQSIEKKERKKETHVAARDGGCEHAAPRVLLLMTACRSRRRQDDSSDIASAESVR